MFFFKQKTAYDMRISDWSSDVCSSDLTIATGSSIPDRRGGRSGGPLDHSRARRPLRMRFFDGGGHLIVTQLREYSRPKAVVVLAPIRSRCGGAVGCRSRGGLVVKCSYLTSTARGAGEIPEALPVAKVPHGHDASSAARLHAIGKAKIEGPIGAPVWPAPAIFGVDLGQESTKQTSQAGNARNVASWRSEEHTSELQ